MSLPSGHPLALPPGPVELVLEIDVRAPAGRIWELLVDFRGWPGLHRGVAFAHHEGELAPGGRLLWRADGMRIRSEFLEVEAERHLALSLRTIGAKGIHRWSLAPDPVSGLTLLRSEEVWDGLAPRFLRRTLLRTLRVSRTAWLEALRERAESD